MFPGATPCAISPANELMPLPVTGVAVAYDGNEATPSNLSIYWTRAEAMRTTADLLIQRQLDTDFPLGTPDFAIGNIRRTPSASNFVGLIDEVRISDVARAADEFIFIPEPGTMLLIGAGTVILLRRRRA